MTTTQLRDAFLLTDTYAPGQLQLQFTDSTAPL